MKSLNEIVGLPIISVLDGQEVGKIKGVIIGPESGIVKYIVIDDSSTFQIKVVALSSILGIGDEALMVESKDLVIDARDSKEVIELLDKNVAVVNSMVFTKKGKNLGSIKELYIEEEDGNILACKIEKDGETKFLSSDYIITYGKNMTIVEHSAQDKLLESIEEIYMNNELLEDEKIPNPVEEIQKNQKEFLLGREVKEKMMEGDTLLAYKGQVVTEELIKLVENAGRFLELTLNVK